MRCKRMATTVTLRRLFEKGKPRVSCKPARSVVHTNVELATMRPSSALHRNACDVDELRLELGSNCYYSLRIGYMGLCE